MKRTMDTAVTLVFGRMSVKILELWLPYPDKVENLQGADGEDADEAKLLGDGQV